MVTGVGSSIKNLDHEGTKEFMMRKSGQERGKAEKRKDERKEPENWQLIKGFSLSQAVCLLLPWICLILTKHIFLFSANRLRNGNVHR